MACYKNYWDMGVSDQLNNVAGLNYASRRNLIIKIAQRFPGTSVGDAVEGRALKDCRCNTSESVTRRFPLYSLLIVHVVYTR